MSNGRRTCCRSYRFTRFRLLICRGNRSVRTLTFRIMLEPLFCAAKPTGSARSDIEWTAKMSAWKTSFYLGKVCEAISAFTVDWRAIFVFLLDVDRLDGLVRRSSTRGSRSARSTAARRRLPSTTICCPLRHGDRVAAARTVANALVNKGVTLGALDRSAEDCRLRRSAARFGTATELPLREQVAKALVNKGVRLGALDRSAEAIAVYDDLLARFGTATELPLREQVAKALVNKGVTLARSTAARRRLPSTTICWPASARQPSCRCANRS